MLLDIDKTMISIIRKGFSTITPLFLDIIFRKRGKNWNLEKSWLKNQLLPHYYILLSQLCARQCNYDFLAL